jgi:hypothetical protein
MAGMSPYIVNAGISYLGNSGFLKSLEAGLYYNVQGESLEVVGVTDYPNIYSVPFHSLNFNSNIGIGDRHRLKVGLKIENLLNDCKEIVYKSFKAEEQYYHFLNPGISFSIRASYSL